MGRKTYKYFFMFIICFAFMFLFMPTQSFAATNDWKYENGTLINSEDASVVIQNVTENEGMLTIGDNRFNDNLKTVSSIDLSGKITDVSNPEKEYEILEIGEDSFLNYRLLEEMVLPESITSIGGSAFYNCEKLNKINLPNSLTYIGDGAFQYCASLEKIIIPNNITTIKERTFDGCRSLSIVVLPNNLTTIEMCAFRYCESLEEITIPESVTSMGIDIFSSCKSLKAVYLLSENPPSIGGEILGSFNEAKIYISYSNLEKYKNDPMWSKYIDSVDYIKTKLTVQNGTGSGNYGDGEIVTIKANEDNEKEHFSYWSVFASPKSNSIIANENARETTITMPNYDTTVVANFEAHDYVNGKCSICGYDDPNYVPTKDDDKNNDNVSSDTSEITQNNKNNYSVNTSDQNNFIYYILGLIVSIIGLGSLVIYKKRKSC